MISPIYTGPATSIPDQGLPIYTVSALANGGYGVVGQYNTRSERFEFFSRTATVELPSGWDVQTTLFEEPSENAQPRMLGRSDGGFWVLWEEYGAYNYNSNNDLAAPLRLMAYDGAGTPLPALATAEQQRVTEAFIGPYPSGTYAGMDLIALDGDRILLSVNTRSTGGSLQIVENDGTVGDAIGVTDSRPLSTAIKAARHDDGGFLATWGTEDGFYTRIFDETGTAAADPQRIFDTTLTNGYTLLDLEKDGFVLIETPQVPFEGGVRFDRRFIFLNEDGTLAADGQAERVPHMTQVGAVSLDDGGFMLVYKIYDERFNSSRFEGRIFEADGSGRTALFGISDYSTDSSINNFSMSQMTDGRVAVSWLKNTYEGADPRAQQVRLIDPRDEPIYYTGNPLDETLLGTEWGDSVSGAQGDDEIHGAAGNDEIFGAAGHDTLYGQDGTDTMIGGGGDDLLVGGDDYLGGTARGGDRRDNLYGMAGDDTLDGGWGNDLLYGGDGADLIRGGSGADTIAGQNGDDRLSGQGLADQMFGNAGDDFINGGFGYDLLNGGAGADAFFHLGVADHGSDWIQDYSAADGDTLAYGGAATADDFQFNRATKASAGSDGVAEGFVIHRPTGQILWALVDGAAQDSIMVTAGGEAFDLLG